MRYNTLLLMSLLGFLPLLSEAATGSAEAGKVKAYTCSGCHGIPGYSNAYPNYPVPKIYGQYQDYIIAALNAYKNNERRHATMQAQAQSLSEQDIADIAAFLSTQKQ